MQAPAGSLRIPLTVGTECIGGCTVHVLLASPRLHHTSSICPEGVPVSKLYDCRASHTHAISTQLEVVQVVCLREL
jgi:hypothetical protein